MLFIKEIIVFGLRWGCYLSKRKKLRLIATILLPVVERLDAMREQGCSLQRTAAALYLWGRTLILIVSITPLPCLIPLLGLLVSLC